MSLANGAEETSFLFCKIRLLCKNAKHVMNTDLYLSAQQTNTLLARFPSRFSGQGGQDGGQHLLDSMRAEAPHDCSCSCLSSITNMVTGVTETLEQNRYNRDHIRLEE